jgi:hypothetical protein
MDTSAASELGRQLTDFLLKQFGTQPDGGDTLGFLGTGIAVDPNSFLSGGAVNPARVNAWLDVVVDPIGSVLSDGNRVQSTPWTATQLMDAIATQAMSAAAPGSDDQQGFAHVRSSAAQALGGDTTVLTAPIDWYDSSLVSQWPKCQLDAKSTTGSVQDSSATPSSGDTPPAKPIWAWRNLARVPLTDASAPTEPAIATPTGGAKLGRLPFMAAAPRPFVHSQFATVAQDMPEGGLDADPGQVRLVRASDIAHTVAVDQDDNIAERDTTLRISRINVLNIAHAISTAGDQATTVSVDSESLSLSFSYLVVRLSRAAWWNDLLLMMNNWYIPGFEQGALVPASSASVTVGMPVALVLTSNVQIQATWSAADRSNASSSTNFGPWALSSSQTLSDSTQGTASLSIPDIQAIACIYRQLPTLPPTGDPALAVTHATSTATSPSA